MRKKPSSAARWGPLRIFESSRKIASPRELARLNKSAAPPAGLLPTLGVAAAVTALATLFSYVLPPNWAATGVGLTFLLATYFLVVRLDDPEIIREYGLSLGGLLEPAPITWPRLGRDATQAVLFALIAAAVIYPFYWYGFRWWWGVDAFKAAPLLPVLWRSFEEVLAIALPEEAFYRGYLQTALDKSLPQRVSVLGARVGPALPLTSAIFALGHLLTDVNPARLAVFFPSLVFGFLRARTGGIGAALLFHAMCNVFSWYLSKSYVR
jgi:membrane protease YdiL (CAAX protease family)